MLRSTSAIAAPFQVELGDVESFLPITPTVFLRVSQAGYRMRELHDLLNRTPERSPAEQAAYVGHLAGDCNANAGTGQAGFGAARRVERPDGFVHRQERKCGGEFRLAQLHTLPAKTRCSSGDGTALQGFRDAPRDALIADSTRPEIRGRAFGFHRGMDHLGAAVGPLLAAAFLWFWPGALREMFLLTLIPGLVAAALIAFVVKEKERKPVPHISFGESLRTLPTGYRKFLVAVGLFGMGDFAHTMLILLATVKLTPTIGTAKAVSIATGLYVLHNVLYAAFSMIALLAIRISRSRSAISRNAWARIPCSQEWRCMASAAAATFSRSASLACAAAAERTAPSAALLYRKLRRFIVLAPLQCKTVPAIASPATSRTWTLEIVFMVS